MKRIKTIFLLSAIFFGASWVRALETSTTLTEQTRNNTSASSSFGTLSNGDIAPGNVSKLSLKELLPPHFSGTVLAHWMPWWKCSGGACEGVHDKRDIVRVHYSATDPAQLDKVIADMISRGYDGVLVAESNSGGADTQGALAMAQEMPKFPAFYFVISENHLNKLHSAVEQTQRLKDDMVFASSHYFNLPNYLKLNGRPVVYIFDNGSIDWASASAQVAGNPLFVIDGPSHASSQLGGFYWFGHLPHHETVAGSEALRSLADFYAKAAANPGRIYSGSFFKGFDDQYAPWTQGRRVDQDCGLTFVRSLASAPANLPLLQVATWNDYEEGTEVETGIDNCGSVSAKVTGTRVQPMPSFTGTGSEETVDHYEIYVSADGEHLSDAGSVPVGGVSFDLKSITLSPGSYNVYVQMVGKSHIINHMSSPAVALVKTSGA